MLFALTSCEETTDYIPQEAEFTINYGFAESGPMTKSGATVYSDFYNAYIKTQILTPDTYTLTFSNETGAVATFYGSWANMDMVKLLEGTYTVTGSSGHTDLNQDLATLSFNQDVVITKATTNIQLTATYNCLLLMFDKTRITEAYYSDGGYDKTNLFSQDNNVLYIFLSDDFTPSANIKYKRDEINPSSTIYLRPLSLQNGYYYYFDDINGTFDVPPMLGE